MRKLTVLLFALFVLAFGMKPDSVKYEIKTTNVLGVPFSAATFTFSFPDSLFLPQSTTCEYCQPSSSPSSGCICDYTLPNACNICSSCNQTLCDQYNTKWTLLHDGVTQTHTVDGSNSLNFRFQMNKSCSAVDFRIDTFYGNPILNVDTNGPPEDDKAQWLVTGFQRPIFLWVCPTDKHFELGTWFVSVSGLGDTKFNITARSPSMPVPNSILDRLSCSPTLPSSLSDHTCMSVDGKAMKGHSTELTQDFYYYNVTHCQQVSFSLHSEDGADADIWYSYTQPRPYLVGAEGVSEFSGDDELTVTLCPKEGQRFSLFYLTVDMWSLGMNGEVNYTLIVNKRHTSSSLRNIPFNQLGYYSAPIDLSSTVFMQLPNSNLTCFDWIFDCKAFWTLSPSTEASSFFPSPPLLSKNENFNGLKVFENVWKSPPSQSNIFVCAVLLNMTVDGVNSIILSESALDSVRIIFRYKLADRFGLPVNGSYSATRNSPICDSKLYQTSKNQIEQLTAKETSDFETIRSNEMEISLVMESDNHYGCIELLQSFITSSSSVSLQNSTSCSTLRYSNEFNTDPCCSIMGNWNKACVPRMKNVTTTGFQLNQQSLQSGNCQNPVCITSLLEDYRFIAASGGCQSASKEDLDLNAGYSTFRDCKEAFYSFESLSCYNDSQCAPSTCDMSRGTCRINKEIQGQNFVRCLVSSMDSLQVFSLETSLQLNRSVGREVLISTFYNSSINSECWDPLSATISDAQKNYYFKVTDRNCAPDCSSEMCEDQSCSFEEDTCLSWCRSVKWFSSSTSSFCPLSSSCNWDSQLCNELNQTECNEECLKGDSQFCGWTEDSLLFFNVPELSNSSSCTSSKVCVYPNVTSDYGLGYSVVDISENCDSIEGSCNLPCNLNSQPPSDSVQNRTECTSRTECEASGYCSINQKIVGGGNEGACAINRILPDSFSAYDGYIDYPFCPLGEISIPKYCISYDYNETDCNDEGTEGRGGKWIVPFTDRQSCEAEFGCLESIQSLIGAPPNQFFTMKSRRDCTLSGGTWEKLYSWTGGSWIPPLHRSLTWQTKRVVQKNSFGPTLNFSAVQETFFSSFNDKIVLELRSSSLCERSRTQNYLDVVSCSCGLHSSSECFADAPLSTPVSQGKPCALSTTTVYADGDYVSTFNTSVDSGCSNVLISTVSGLQFLGVGVEGLGGRFMDVRKEINYGIVNSRRATVGVLIGDGLVINLDQAMTGLFRVCISLRDLGSQQHSYSTYDFATSDADYSVLIPLNLPVWLNGSLLCSDIQSSNLTLTFFPIKRLSNWNTVTQYEIAKTEFVLSYILAAFYSVISFVSALGFMFAIYYIFILKTRKILLTDYILIFIFLFALIRTIYFSLSNKNQATDFILAALPTFLYFTSFSLVISFWAVSSQKYLFAQPKKMIRYGTILILLTNGLLYLLLLIIGILFYEFNKTSSPCGRRSTQAVEQQREKLRDLSITYAVIVSVVCIVFALSFAYLGFKLVRRMTKSSGTKKTILRIAAVFSVSFTIYSVFIIAQSLLSSNPIPAFSFVGLILTEVLPSSFFVASTMRYFIVNTIRSQSDASNSKKTRGSVTETRGSITEIPMAIVTSTTQEDDMSLEDILDSTPPKY